MDKIISDYLLGISICKIAQLHGICDTTVRRRLKKAGVWIKHKQPINRKTKYQYNQQFFDYIDCEIKAYWLGFIAADGCLRVDNYDRKSVVICLSEKDKSHLLKFIENLNSDLKIHDYKQGKYKKSVLHMSGNLMFDSLVKCGLTPRKSLTLKWPNCVNENLLSHFMRGYFDGDGCWTIRKSGQLRFNVVGSEEFIRKFQNILILKCGVSKTKLYKNKKNNKVFSLDYSGFNATNIGKFIYENSNIHLERKYNKYQSAKKLDCYSKFQNKIYARKNESHY